MVAGIAVAAGRGIDARRGEQQFARIDEILRFGIAFKGVPLLAGHEVEEAQIVGHRRGVIGLPRLAVDLIRHERFDHRAGI
jgi:hypothetical protein